MKLLLVLGSIIFTTHMFSQTVTSQSTFDLGVFSFLGKGGITTQDGGTLVLNTTGAGIVGDKTEASFGSNDFWIVKYNANNIIEWDKTIGGDNNDIVESAVQKNNGNYLITGTSSSGVSGVKSSTNKGGSDIWVMELTATGNLIWEKSFGGADNELVRDIILTSNNIWVLGITFSNISGDRLKPYYGSGDNWLLKLDLNGNLIEEFTYGGDNYEEAYGLVHDATFDHLYILSSSESGVSGNKSAINYGADDIWMVKIDVQGNVLTDNAFGGVGSEFLSTKPVISNSKLYFSCSSDSDISGNKTEVHYGTGDIWIVCLDFNLQKIAEKTVGGSFGDFPRAINVIGSQISVASVCYSQNTGNITATTNGQGDIFIIGLNTENLDLVYQDMVGGDLLEFALAIFPLNTGGLRILSTTTSDMSGDLQLNNPNSANGGSLFWMFNYESALSLATNTNDNLQLLVYPNPVVRGSYLEFNKLIDLLEVRDLKGSLVTKRKNVKSFDTSSLQSGVYFFSEGLNQVKIVVTN